MIETLLHPTTWLYPLLLAAGWIASGALTGVVVRELRRRQVMDLPNARSSHRLPTPRGGGWGILPPVLIGWAAIAWFGGEAAQVWPALAACFLLALVCWADDLRPVSPLARLAAQGIAVTIALAALPSDALIFQGLLPLPIDRLVAGIGWVWWVNLYNFMDGIDGISGVETVTISLGVLMLLLALAVDRPLGGYAAILAGCALGFLAWNWAPARVFLGDVGSVPLGFLTGWLLLVLAGAGLWLPAAILPLYYACDGTITLLRRLAKGERVWQPHRQHFYQRAVDRGRTPVAVIHLIMITNVGLIIAAIAAVETAWAVVPAIALVAWALYRMVR
jgi:UDP-N-acetylmuramyl pentapeptide phosphotransferase/UDP-N-acetylglucosamine-1-phosphate transferase